ncbi:MAG: hypothetical protein DBX47_05510 [Clostridiales bacterium]|nr:MAG: hypothetical protein DBX47_05510 [Clostridiales bacterium]
MHKIKTLIIPFLISLIMILSACSVSVRDFTTTDGDVRAYFVENSYKAEKLQTDIPSTKNSFEIIMCKNEAEGGQFILRNDLGQIKNASVSVSELEDSNGNVIPPNRVKIYRGKYMNLFAFDQNVSYPDALIPMEYEDLNSFTAEKGENLPYYIEVKTVESDVASTYKSTATVTFDSGKIDIPITVKVYDILLPTTPSTAMSVSGPWDIDTVYEGKDVNARAMLYNFLLDYKFSLEWITSDASSPERFVENILPYVKDERVTKFMAPLYGETDENGYYVFNVAKMTRLVELFRQNGIMDKACWAKFDEPYKPEDLDCLAKFNRDLLAIAPDAHHSCAIAYHPELLPDGLETWILSWNSVNEPMVSAILASGNRVWRYGTEETLIGNNNSVEAKIRFWHQEQLGITGYLQWAGDNFRIYDTTLNPPAYKDEIRDIWNDPYCFYPVEQYPMYSVGGDSYLVYPGLEGDGIINRNIIVPTVRIAALRDGADDYEMLLIRRAQVEKQLKKYGIDTNSDAYMSVYYEALNDITNDTAGNTLSNFDRYITVKQKLLDDIIADSDVLFAIEIPKDESSFSIRNITVAAPEKSTIIFNGNQLTQNGYIATTSIILNDPISSLTFTVNGREYTYNIYPKVVSKGSELVDLSNISALIEGNQRLPESSFSYSDGLLNVNFTDKVKILSIPLSMLEYSDLSSQGKYLAIEFKNKSDFDISNMDVSFHSGPSRGYVKSDTSIKSGEVKTIYYDLSSADVDYSNVSKLIFTFAQNASVEIMDIRMVDII